ncbi:MAG: hypothetical protein WKF86_09775 [Acidimicrobiales bacterium]
MIPQPGGAAGRRTITLVAAALAVVAIIGGLAFAATGSVGNGCGSGLKAARTSLPSPLLTDADKAEIDRTKQNPYEFASAKARPFEECRDAGSKRLITAGALSGLLLLPVLGILAYVYLYWPRHHS